MHLAAPHCLLCRHLFAWQLHFSLAAVLSTTLGDEEYFIKSRYNFFISRRTDSSESDSSVWREVAWRKFSKNQSQQDRKWHEIFHQIGKSCEKPKMLNVQQWVTFRRNLMHQICTKVHQIFDTPSGAEIHQTVTNWGSIISFDYSMSNLDGKDKKFHKYTHAYGDLPKMVREPPIATDNTSEDPTLHQIARVWKVWCRWNHVVHATFTAVIPADGVWCISDAPPDVCRKSPQYYHTSGVWNFFNCEWLTPQPVDFGPSIFVVRSGTDSVRAKYFLIFNIPCGEDFRSLRVQNFRSLKSMSRQVTFCLHTASSAGAQYCLLVSSSLNWFVLLLLGRSATSAKRKLRFRFLGFSAGFWVSRNPEPRKDWHNGPSPTLLISPLPSLYCVALSWCRQVPMFVVMHCRGVASCPYCVALLRHNCVVDIVSNRSPNCHYVPM